MNLSCSTVGKLGATCQLLWEVAQWPAGRCKQPLTLPPNFSLLNLNIKSAHARCCTSVRICYRIIFYILVASHQCLDIWLRVSNTLDPFGDSVKMQHSHCQMEPSTTRSTPWKLLSSWYSLTWPINWTSEFLVFVFVRLRLSQKSCVWIGFTLREAFLTVLLDIHSMLGCYSVGSKQETCWCNYHEHGRGVTLQPLRLLLNNSQRSWTNYRINQARNLVRRNVCLFHIYLLSIREIVGTTFQ